MKKLWKIYAVLYVLLVIILLISDSTDSKLEIIDYVDIIISLPTVIAVAGWAWRKNFGVQGLWITYAVLFFCFDILYNFFLDNHAKDTNLFSLIADVLLILPSYIATILYALNFDAIKQQKSPVIFQNTTSPSAAHSHASTSSAPMAAWGMHGHDQNSDAQLMEIKHQQTTASAKNAMGASLAKEVQASYDEKIEAEQLGKWPWERWYSHPVMGRNVEKGIADIIFLSLFGSSSATDRKYTKTQRAIIRIILTLAVMAILSQLGQFLTQPR